jgi:hypothetical protein
MTSQLDRIETMLKAILASDNHIHWIGSYAHGRTSTGDPYIVLFPASDKLEHKVCRVYESQFKKLPDFVNTNVPPSVRASKNTPAKDRATACQSFQIVTSDGKDTQMGAEKRFFGVLNISSYTPAPQAETAVPQPAPPPATKKAASPPPDSFFRAGDEVLVKGKTEEKPGVVTGLSQDGSGKVAVKVEGTIYRLAPECLIPVSLS